MTRAVKRLSEESGARDAAVLARTRSRVDVGQWFRQTRVWAACLPSELVLLAPGRRPFVERIPYDQLKGSLYNHITGELELAPAEKARLRRLRVSPLDGCRMLRMMVREDKEQPKGAEV